jgi:hypothetical protein
MIAELKKSERGGHGRIEEQKRICHSDALHIP